jgi:hypothetical protein
MPFYKHPQDIAEGSTGLVAADKCNNTAAAIQKF